MIRLLEKLLIQRDAIHSEYGKSIRYTQDYQKRLSIIRKILIQEKEMFEGRKVSDRIVSIIVSNKNGRVKNLFWGTFTEYPSG